MPSRMDGISVPGRTRCEPCADSSTCVRIGYDRRCSLLATIPGRGILISLLRTSRHDRERPSHVMRKLVARASEHELGEAAPTAPTDDNKIRVFGVRDRADDT